MVCAAGQLRSGLASAGLALAGFGWLAFRISVGFGLIGLGWLRFGFGWIWLLVFIYYDFGWISFDLAGFLFDSA